MLCRNLLSVATLMCTGVSVFSISRAEEPIVPRAVVCAKNASFAERLAAKEIRRYVYLRTGSLLPMVEDLESQGDTGLIVVGCKHRPAGLPAVWLRPQAALR